MMGERDPQAALWNYRVNLDKRVRSDHRLRRINAPLTIDISRDAQQDPGLGDRTRAKNENVDQSFCALCPIRPGCHVGNADESPEQIEWIEVRPDVAAFDRSHHQRIDGSFDLSARGFK